MARIAQNRLAFKDPATGWLMGESDGCELYRGSCLNCPHPICLKFEKAKEQYLELSHTCSKISSIAVGEAGT